MSGLCLKQTDSRHVYMLGVGGMGMAPLALYLAGAGFRVTGYDDNLQTTVRDMLSQAGVTIQDNATLPEDIGLLAFSSAFHPEHPLLREARSKGTTIFRRGELLARLMEGKKLLAVVGSHGKTTTTALLVHLLREESFSCGYLIGALPCDPSFPPARYEPNSEWVVAEIDESDGTIEHFNPEAVLTVNFDWDHPDRYTSAEALKAAFGRLYARTRRVVFIPENSPDLMELAPGAVSYPSKDGDFMEHNWSAAKAAATLLLGREPVAERRGFCGVRRRQEILHNSDGVRVIADYAHHPAEVAAFLRYAERCFPGKQVVVFQPHRYTRTKQFAAQFKEVLSSVPEVILLPVYAASEEPMEAGLAENISAEWLEKDLEAVIRKLYSLIQAKQTDEVINLLFVGAGDIDSLARRFAMDLCLLTRLGQGLGKDSSIVPAEPIGKKTTLGVGGCARFFAQPASIEDLSLLLRRARQWNVPVFILGRGSNLIVPDDGFDGLVVSLKHSFWRQMELREGGRLWARAGVRLKELCALAAKADLAGFEFLEGIPGSVGGSLRMNAGAMGGWIFDVVEAVEFVTFDGEVHYWEKERFHVTYRRCAELTEAVATGALFAARGVDRDESIRHRMDSYANKRKESQPREPSAGCIFKNPKDGHAGKIIDELGLKGSSVGAAEVSTVHGNFIINRGGATSRDVLELIRRIRQKVKEERGIELEPEVLLLGKRWEDVL